MFFKSFLELDLANMVQILSFESRVVKELLDDLSEEDINPRYPLFYKMQQKTFESQWDYLTPIDIALENNQIRGLNSMITYIVKYQNNYAFSFLF